MEAELDDSLKWRESFAEIYQPKKAMICQKSLEIAPRVI